MAHVEQICILLSWRCWTKDIRRASSVILLTYKTQTNPVEAQWGLIADKYRGTFGVDQNANTAVIIS